MQREELYIRHNLPHVNQYLPGPYLSHFHTAHDILSQQRCTHITSKHGFIKFDRNGLLLSHQSNNKKIQKLAWHW